MAASSRRRYAPPKEVLRRQLGTGFAARCNIGVAAARPSVVSNASPSSTRSSGCGAQQAAEGTGPRGRSRGGRLLPRVVRRDGSTPRGQVRSASELEDRTVRGLLPLAEQQRGASLP